MVVRLLLTRPAERGADLLNDARAQGFEVKHLPLQTLHPIVTTAPAIEPIPAAIIVVSVKAAQLGAALLPLAWRNRVPLLAVGQATAHALAAAGWPQAQTPSIENSEYLLQLTALQNLAGKRVIILRGEIGRELISDTLQAQGALVEPLLLYRSSGPDAETAHAIATWVEKPGVIVISSTQALRELCAIIPPSAHQSQRLLCLGPRIATEAQQHFQHVSVISSLTIQAITDVL